MESPEVVFVGTPPIHEHIYSNGFICLSVLYDGWSPAMNASSICNSILSMISSATEKKKPDNDLSTVSRVKGKSPKDLNWVFEDDKC